MFAIKIYFACETLQYLLLKVTCFLCHLTVYGGGIADSKTFVKIGKLTQLKI